MTVEGRRGDGPEGVGGEEVGQGECPGVDEEEDPVPSDHPVPAPRRVNRSLSEVSLESCDHDPGSVPLVEGRPWKGPRRVGNLYIPRRLYHRRGKDDKRSDPTPMILVGTRLLLGPRTRQWFTPQCQTFHHLGPSPERVRCESL